MKKELFKEIEIPSGIEVSMTANVLTIKGPEGEITRKFRVPQMVFEKKDNKIVVGSKKATKNEKRIMNSIAAHIKNMIKGVQNKFEYKLKVCSSHFPMTVDIAGREVTIKNFLGEKVARKTTIPEGVEVIKDGVFLIIKSVNKEKAGQAAASIESATRISGRDKRIFQDGVYIIDKAGREI